ncbi:MAG: hypothetical protein KDD00_00620 [Ignavibacteriae bacterium]|nr:hypothetical protein [Ignavibacteriota bacterium]
MKTSYRILFTILIQHDFYTQAESFDDIEIIPTLKSRSAFEGNRILYRFVKNRFTAMIEVDGDEPFVNINSDTKLRFILKLKNPSFSNFSGIKLFGLNDRIYYFSNRSDNETGNVLYLSKSIPGHDPGDEYEVGSLIQSGQDVFEAISDNTTLPPPGIGWRKLLKNRFPAFDQNNHSDIHKGNIVSDNSGTKNFEAIKFIPRGQAVSLNDLSYWKEVTGLQYVTPEDLIERKFISVSKYDIMDHNEIFPGDVLFNPGDSKLYEALKYIEKGNQVHVSNAGYWKESDVTKFVISEDKINSGENIFGIIDLFFDGSVPVNHRMLDGSGNVKETEYAIRFKNRISTWKYISQKNSVTSLTDTSGVYNFIKNSNEFTSDTPVPLLLKPIQKFKLDADTGSQTISVENIKCASADIKPIKATKSFVSEIYLNY